MILTDQPPRDVLLQLIVLRYFQRPVARDWTARRARPTRTSCTARRVTARRSDPRGTGSRGEQPDSLPTCRQVCSVMMI